ncbi:MAG: hypothetical protein ETSY2_08100 [Candidatus Entotheonella gemina]|uniref:Uncharacterized protein n=1 Tax=Candidatus Entotheonella gemina TaxID=1429439 RepID=W4MDH1_9BACT|nr:MAG: hypothetical protein ETSY2_08100 [Candidatus Entotheonella gemina]
MTEIVAGMIAVLGLGAGVGAWLLGANMAESTGVVIGFLLPSVMLALVGAGLRTGQMGMKGNKIYRDKSPLKFWGVAIFYVLIGGIFFLFVLMMLLLRV